MFYFLFWAGVLALSGHSSSSSRAGQEAEAGSRVDFEAAGEDGLLRALDNLFEPHTIAKQTVINVVGVREYRSYKV